MRTKADELFRDLFRDLRDRRLLPVVIGLAVAIVAVPLLLGGGGEEPVPPVAAGGPVEGGDPLAPVVLADVPGLRDYRKRLSRFHSRDPFKQQMTGSNTAQGGKGNLEEVDSGDAASGGSSLSTGDASTEEPSTEPTGTPGDDSNAGGNGNGGNGNGGNGGRGGEDRVVRTTIDVRVGQAGATKVVRGVEPLQFLPGKKRPVVQYVEGDSEATRAAFVVSPEVTETAGDGRCDPGRDDCQFVLMEEGDLRTFVYGANGKTYRLQLLAIHRTTVPARDGRG